jgi:polyphosphate kinase
LAGVRPAVRAAVEAVRVGAARPDRFLNRELSWLDFDRRVLELAADPGLPLLERVNLCAIVSSNLDEFFAVRVARLLRQAAASNATPSPDGRLPAETLADCRDRVLELTDDQAALWLDELQPALAQARIRIVPVDECRPRELTTLARRFAAEIAPMLSPVAVGALAPFPHARSLALGVGVSVRDPDTAGSRFIRINIPPAVPRLVSVGRGTFVLLENAIAEFVPMLVGDVDFTGLVAFRITRDSDISISRDADDVLEAVETQLLERRFANVVRLEVGAGAPAGLADLLERELIVPDGHVYQSDAPVGLGDLRELAQLDRPDLRESRWRPVTRRPFAKRSPAAILARIRRGDVLAHHPYDSFDATVGAFVAAARDPKVAALKATIYRSDRASTTLASLVKAADENKQSVCVIELNARFDERRNVDSSRALERAGVDVVFGEPDLKVHAKLALLVRREGSVTRRYAHIGTGNYHASNASKYEDLGLFTADEDIAADVADVFNAVAARTRPAPFRKLLVGPWFLRDGIMSELERVAAAARDGETARVRIKVNSVVDPGVVDALYAAAGDGARIDIVTRGICALRPGFGTPSERIAVRSVLGRFLEHSRIFSFEAGQSSSMWIGSADLMPRNFDRRVEVLAPIENPRLRAEIETVFDALLADTRFSWRLEPDGSWTRVSPKPGELPVSAQEALMERARQRAKAA